MVLMSESAQDPQSKAIIWSTATADYYSLLTILFQTPTHEVIQGYTEELIIEDYYEVAQEMGIVEASINEAADYLRQAQNELANNQNALSFIRQEYTRLFSHPASPVIPLYEGVFVDSERVAAGLTSSYARLFINPAAINAEKFYRQAGFDCNKQVSVPADCITTELEYLGQLNQLIAQSIMACDDKQVAALNELLVSFWKEHVINWMPRFFERCQEESRIALYKAAGMMGRILMDEKERRLTWN